MEASWSFSDEEKKNEEKNWRKKYVEANRSFSDKEKKSGKKLKNEEEKNMEAYWSFSDEESQACSALSNQATIHISLSHVSFLNQTDLKKKLMKCPLFGPNSKLSIKCCLKEKLISC